MEPTALDTLVGAPRWRTFRPERCVLVVVHNVTALTRLLEVLPLLSGDPRVQLVYTCTGSSAFQRGTIESLMANEMRYVPWDTAVRLRFDLAISASYGGELHELNSPLLTVPHGMGYNIIQSKTENRKPKTENRKPASGLRFVS
jgi:hypothetical protein